MCKPASHGTEVRYIVCGRSEYSLRDDGSLLKRYHSRRGVTKWHLIAKPASKHTLERIERKAEGE